MIPWQAAVAWVALLCAVGRCQNDRYENLKKEYLEKCKSSHPNVKNMEVSGYDPSSCSYWCQWKNEKGNYDSDRRRKDDGVKCIGYTFPQKEPQQCLNATCVLSADVHLCKDRAPYIGKLQHLDSDRCIISCIGDSKRMIQKPEGSTCASEGELQKPAKCNVFGRCAEVIKYESDPEGGTEANEDAQRAADDVRHPEGVHQNYATRWPDPCQWVCHYTDGPDGMAGSEYLSFENGYTCGEGKECLGGRCVKPKDIQACQEKIREDVLEMDYKDCKMFCYGKTSEAFIKMPLNSTCQKLTGFQWEDGVCNSGGKCIVKK